MWKRIDTPLKRSLISDREGSSQNLRGSLKDSKITVFLFLWAVIVTGLLFHQIGLPPGNLAVEGENLSISSVGGRLQGAEFS